MNKIVELLIDWDNLDIEDLGVSIMSLVEEPAIGIAWQKFAAQKFVSVNPGESEEDYIARCIPVLIEEGFDQDQAAAICYGSYEEAFLPENPCQSGYVAYGTKIKDGREVPNCVPVTAEMEFESYTDYPEAARNNAKRAIEWKEENGSDCGTQVGWTRARQLADGKPISEETIARMASFARHEQHKDVPYSEGCGGIMWDAWGGSAGVNWAQSKLTEIRASRFSGYTDEHLDKIEALVKQSDFGRVFDPKTTSYVDMSKDQFATEEEVIQGIGALNDLLRSDTEDDNSRFLFRYDQGRSLPSGSESRRFCRILMNANKYFTLEEIDQMSTEPLQPDMGPGGTNTYDILKYKGGVNCRHRWLQYRQYDANGRTVVAELGPATINREAGQIASSSNNWWRMSKSNQWHFSEDEQMVVTGPAMVPNMMIPRYDKDGNMFHVYFSQDTVKKIARKFLEENKQHNTDINHDDAVTTENTLLESWIVEDPDMDKSKTLGFDVPKSTWMVSYKINNQETWDQIKEGKLNGFSITGQFIESNTKS